MVRVVRRDCEHLSAVGAELRGGCVSLEHRQLLAAWDGPNSDGRVIRRCDETAAVPAEGGRNNTIRVATEDGKLFSGRRLPEPHYAIGVGELFIVSRINNPEKTRVERYEVLAVGAQDSARHLVAAIRPKNWRREKLLAAGHVPEANAAVLCAAHDSLAVGRELGG